MKAYRQDAHVIPLVFWAILCIAAAGFLFVHGHRLIDRRIRDEEIAAGAVLLILGPAVFAVYLIRARLIWVALDPARGILLRGERLIPWGDILGVIHRPPRFRKNSGPVNYSPPGGLSDASGCVDPGCSAGCFDVSGLGEAFAVLGFILAALVAVWFILFVFVPLLVIPLLEVLAPFGDRVTLVTRNGTFVLRDLSEAEEFVGLVLARPRRQDR